MLLKLLFSKEERLRQRFLKDKNNKTLNDLLAFMISHNQPLPVNNPEFRDALFSINSWKVDESYQDFLFSSVESYLFEPTQQSQAHEWDAWLGSSRTLNHQFDVLRQDFAEAIEQVYRSRKLQKLSQENFLYLISNYPKAYRDVLGHVDLEVWPIKFKMLLELSAHCRSIALVKDTAREAERLTDLVTFLEQHDCPFPIEDTMLRNTLFKVKFWELKLPTYDRIFRAIENYLFSNVRDSHNHEWTIWIRAYRQLERPIDVMQPSVAQALRDAQRAGKLDDLPTVEHQYLLHNYLRVYGNILEEMEPGTKEALPLLLEFASIAQIVGPSDFSMRILERWTKDLPPRPRSLADLRDEQAFFAPIMGVGSPHGVSITQYHLQSARVPERIACAGVTGDGSLNAQIFTALFSTALACDNEPTFVTTVGSLLSLRMEEPSQQNESDGPENRFYSQPLLHAVIGPDGPREPTAGTPLVGMDADEALSLVRDLFERFQESTGLVQIKRWRLSDAKRLDHQIREMLEGKDEGNLVIKSDIRHTEGTGLIHIMPLLHRNETGQAVPVSISIPYHVLGAESIFKLVHASRRAYMKQLIAACHQRKMLAERTFREQNMAVMQWQRLSAEEKRSILESAPTVHIHEIVDFQLGIVTRLEKPETKPRTVYENETRPMLRDSAKSYAQKYEQLGKKLIELDREGGRADILTFKLLVDSMIRRAALPFAYMDLQKDYEAWVQNNSDMVWKAVDTWAQKRGLSADLLAADNVLFNARLDTEDGNMFIEPWITVDMHDFVVYIDQKQGIMEAYPGGRTPTLTEVLIPDAERNIVTPNDLLNTFYTWLDQSLNLQVAREREEDEVRSKIMGDPDIKTLLQLQIAKRLLGRGYDEDAITILNRIRKADMAAIYFWGAVAYQYKFLKNKNVELRLGLEGLENEEKVQRLLNIAIAALIEAITPAQASGKQPDFLFDVQSGQWRFVAPQRMPLDEDAIRYLDQLLEKDQSFGEGLVHKNDLYLLERQSLHLSRDAEARLAAALSALSALELLKLAEHLKNVAKKLPFTEMWTADLKGYIDQLINHANSLSIQPSTVAAEINQLRKLTHN